VGGVSVLKTEMIRRPTLSRITCIQFVLAEPSPDSCKIDVPFVIPGRRF